MKLNIFYTLTFLGFAAFILSFSNGPAGGSGNNGPRMQDRSGSPFAESMGPTCATCHNTGSFNPSLNIELMQDGQSVDSYNPGTTYTLRYTVMAGAGSPSKYGVQSVVLSNNGNQNIGIFGTPSTGTRVAEINTRKYFEHSSASSSNVFEIEWIAPDAGSGEVKVYAAGIAANDNGTNAGDNGVANTLLLTELVSSLRAPESLAISILASPNPMGDIMKLHIESEVSGHFQLELTDLSGKSIFTENIDLQVGEHVFTKDVADLAGGIYLLKVTDGVKVRVLRVVRTDD